MGVEKLGAMTIEKMGWEKRSLADASGYYFYFGEEHISVNFHGPKGEYCLWWKLLGEGI